ncbi:hypothetical protein Hdeb2414_s0015g00449641 [Helianthus debilis subsp. tardiflorus]
MLILVVTFGANVCIRGCIISRGFQMVLTEETLVISLQDWEAWPDLNLEHGKLFAGTRLGSMEVLVRCFYTLETTTNWWNSFCQATD